MKKWLMAAAVLSAAGLAQGEDWMNEPLIWEGYSNPATAVRKVVSDSTPTAVSQVKPPKSYDRGVTEPDAGVPESRPDTMPAVRQSAEVPAASSPALDNRLGRQQEATGKTEEEGPSTPDRLREERLWRLLEAAEKRAADAEAALSQKKRGPQAARTEAADDGSAAAMEQRSRLSVQGGGGSDNALNFEAKLTQPLWDSPFDLSLRGYYQSVDYIAQRTRQERYSRTHSYYSYWSGRHYYTTWHTRTVYYEETETMESYGCDVALVFRPFRGKQFSPYAGVGGCFDGNVPEDADSLLFAWRFGGTLNLGRVWLDGTCSIRKSTKDINAVVGYRLNQRMALNASLAWFIPDDDDDEDDIGDGVTVGGGLTFVF